MQENIPALIEEAAAEAGSEYKLAKELGITPQELSGMKYGRRACPPDIQAVMTAMVGRDAIAALVAATVERLSEQRRKSFQHALEMSSGFSRI